MDKDIYINLKENSIGSKKKCPNTRTTKKLSLKIPLSIVTAALLSTCAIGIKTSINNNEEKTTNTKIEYTYDYYGYSTNEIYCYEKLRSSNLLKDNGFTDYTIVDNKVDYKYTAEDYKQIEDLNETYLYGFYIYTNEKSINEISKALGYNDLKDYLISNNHIDENGKESITEWRIHDLGVIGKIMSEAATKGKIR